MSRTGTQKKRERAVKKQTGVRWWTALIKSARSSDDALRVIRSTSSTVSHLRPPSCCWSIRRRLSSSLRTPVPSPPRPPFDSPGPAPEGRAVWLIVTSSSLALISLLIFSLPILPGALASLGWRTGLTLRSRLLNAVRGFGDSRSSSPFESSSMSNESHSTPSYGWAFSCDWTL